MDFYENLKCILNEEKFYEMASVTKEGIPSIKIQADRGRNYFGIEYFKVYNQDSYDKATKATRISFREPVYISHNNPDGKQPWVLNAKERKLLISQMNKPSRLFKNSGLNLKIWHDCIAHFNNEAYGIDFDDTLKIFSNSKTKYLPIDLPMPDYKEL